MSEWKSTTLGEICADGALQTGPFGSQLHASDYQMTGVPVVMPQDLVGGRVSEASIARISEDDAQRLGRHRLRPGDIVYSRRGDVTRNAWVTEREDGWLCGTGCLLVRPGGAADGRWLAFWLSAPWTREWIVRHAVGATMPNLNTSILSAVPVDLPPLEEQRRIAGFLGAFDDLIEMHDCAWARVRDFSSALYADFLQHWDGEQDLGAVARVSESKTKPGVGRIRYVDIAAMGDGHIEIPDAIDWEDAPSRARMLAEDGATLWSTVRPNRRAHGLLVESPDDLVVSTGIAVIEPDGLGPAELFAACDRQEFVDHLLARASGSAYPAVRSSDFRTVPIPRLRPEHSEHFESVCWPLWKDAHAGLLDNERLIRTRDELLPLLMSGRVRVGDAEGMV